MKNKFNFYKEKAQKREYLKTELPIDKQLEGSLGRTKWTFNNPLYALRNSDSSSDKYFITKLKEYNKEGIIDSSLYLIKEAQEKEEHELAIYLKGLIFFVKCISDSDAGVRQGVAKSLGALASVNPELYIQLYEKGLSDSDAGVRWEVADSLGALASVNPELASQLYEKGLSDSDAGVRQGVANSLGALASVNPELASQLYEKGLSDSDAGVRRGVANSLGALASVNPELASQLYEKGLSDSNGGVRWEVADSLGALASVNPELASQLYEKGLSDSDAGVRWEVANSLGALASVNPELYSQLYEKGLSDSDGGVRREVANSLGALASVNPELYSQLYEKGLSDSDAGVRQGVANSLGALASVNPELASQLYEKGLSDSNGGVRQGVAKSLGALASVNPELASQLYEKGLSDSDGGVRRGVAKSLGALASVNPELASQLYEKGLSDSDAGVRRGVANSLGALASVNPELASQLYEKGLSDSNGSVRWEVADSLGALASVNPELASQLYEKGLSDSNGSVRQEVADSLGALASVNPELASQLYEKGLSDSDADVRQEVAKSLGALASVNSELYSQLYEKGLSDSDAGVRWGVAKSLGALASVNPELYSQLYEKGLSDSNSGVRWEVADSLGALASVNPELASQLYEKGLSDSDADVRQLTARFLIEYPFQVNLLIEKVFKIISKRTDKSNVIFVNNILGNLISEKQAAQIWQYLEVLEKVRGYLEEKNAELDAVKQIDSVEKFFADNQIELSNLAKIFNPKDFGVFLVTLSTNTLLYTKSFLEIARPVYSDELVSRSFKEYFSKNSLRQDEIEKIFETGAHFINSNRTEQLISIVDKGENVQESLDRTLLDVVAEEVGIDSKILPSESLGRWNIPYLSYLGSNNRMIEARVNGGEDNYENVQALYKKIVEHGFRGDFKEFILDLDSGDKIGKDIAKHNQNVFAKFKDLGIDSKVWYQYSDTQDFLVSKEIKVDNTKHFHDILGERVKVVIDLLLSLKSELSPRQYEPLIHILQGAKNKGLADISNYEELKKQYRLLKERIVSIKEELFKDSKEEYFGSLFEHLGHLEEAVELFQAEKLTGIETKEQGFRAKLWERDPARDLFQGNYTHCCIAVGVKDAPQEGGLYTHDPATVAQFLADAGMQVVEVYDQEKKDPIANTWLFVSRDRNGEPVLVLDNVEVNNKYKDVVVNTAIRDNLFAFVKKFAQECNIPKIGIGMVGTNDIEWQTLDKMVVAPVDKVGGYLKDYTSSNGARAGRYYLEAYNSQTLGEIYNEEKDKSAKSEKKEKIFAGSLTVIDMHAATSESFDNTEAGIQSFIQRKNLSFEQLQSDIENIENSSFINSELAESIEDIMATLTSPQSIGFFFMESDKVVGYLSSLRADLFSPIVDHSEYDSSEKALYIESIAGKVDPYQALQKLKEQARAGGYEKIILHGINPRLNRALTRFGFETKAQIDDWGAERADYMELVLD